MLATSGAPERGSSVSTPSPQMVPGLRWRRMFPGDERELSSLRRWLASLFPACPARDDLAVVANELSSNAIRHTASGRGGWFAVEVTWSGLVVRVAVADGGAATQPHVIDDPEGEHGRGLVVVRELSMRMGVCGDYRGRLMWADVRWEAGLQPGEATPDGFEGTIRDGQAVLARRFAGVPAWFGRSTLAWWAVAGRAGLVSAPTALDLAGLLYRLLDASEPGDTPEAVQTHDSGANRRSVGQPGHRAAGREPGPRGRSGTASTSLDGSKSGHPTRSRHLAPAAAPGLVAASAA